MRATNGRHRPSNGLPYTRVFAAFMLATLISTIFALPGKRRSRSTAITQRRVRPEGASGSRVLLHGRRTPTTARATPMSSFTGTDERSAGAVTASLSVTGVGLPCVVTLADVRVHGAGHGRERDDDDHGQCHGDRRSWHDRDATLSRSLRPTLDATYGRSDRQHSCREREPDGHEDPHRGRPRPVERSRTRSRSTTTGRATRPAVQLTDTAPAGVTFGAVTVASLAPQVSTCVPAPTATSVAVSLRATIASGHDGDHHRAMRRSAIRDHRDSIANTATVDVDIARLRRTANNAPPTRSSSARRRSTSGVAHHGRLRPPPLLVTP